MDAVPPSKINQEQSETKIKDPSLIHIEEGCYDNEISKKQ